MKVNKNYQNLANSYLFSTINQKTAEFKAKNPDKTVISLGIGDVTKPLAPAVIKAFHEGVDEMGKKESFKGYGEEQGYTFLREAIQGYMAEKGVTLSQDEIFISDGALADLGNILDITADGNVALIPDPVYPSYVDTSVMAGREIIYMNGTEENNFLPMPDSSVKCDLIYLCSPNNPTGAVYSKEQLKAWVDYANQQGAIIIFDAAYESFVGEGDLPSSILQIEGARTCAIEFCSFSKTAGFTGTRCGYTLVPMELEREGMNLNRMWLRRQTTKTNGVSYIVQRGALGIFSEEGRREVAAITEGYKENARIITETLRKNNIWYTGGEHSPYIWIKCPGGMGSWEFFDYLLETAAIVGVPGAGFGQNGEGFFRLTSFGDQENILEALKRINDTGVLQPK